MPEPPATHSDAKIPRASVSREIDALREVALDHALAATFPASDPVSLAQPGGGARSFANLDLDAAI
ncbi:MAG TPA: hypothetical protein VKU62_12280 [Thermoanaerobaculia bacterium]|nr:hypothetical protein [Thermoanaerobaculia bacterium]